MRPGSFRFASALITLLILLGGCATRYERRVPAVSDLPGVWETRWQGSRIYPVTGARETIVETIELKTDGTFKRLQRSVEFGGFPTTMEGKYEINGPANGVFTSV